MEVRTSLLGQLIQTITNSLVSQQNVCNKNITIFDY